MPRTPRSTTRVTKEAALDLLRRNSAAAAAAIRAFSDEELDRAAAASLYCRCPDHVPVHARGSRRPAQLSPPCPYPGRIETVGGGRVHSEPADRRDSPNNRRAPAPSRRRRGSPTRPALIHSRNPTSLFRSDADDVDFRRRLPILLDTIRRSPVIRRSQHRHVWHSFAGAAVLAALLTSVSTLSAQSGTSTSTPSLRRSRKGSMSLG